MKLIVLHLVQNHISYLLTRFKGTEWSGPAFYSCKMDKHGFPEEWTLEGIVPLDLGGTASTEWGGEDFHKAQKEIYKLHPEYRQCYVGLIHSHHELNGGAYFSGTDTNQLEEAANKVGYPSLVVSTISGKTHAFAISYKDNFNQTHVIESEDIVVRQPKVKVEKEWQKWANRIKKKSDSQPKNLWTYNRNQGTLGLGYNHTNHKKKQKQIDKLERKYDKMEMKYDDIRLAFQNGKASNEQVEAMKDKLQKIADELYKLTGYHSPGAYGGYVGGGMYGGF